MIRVNTINGVFHLKNKKCRPSYRFSTALVPFSENFHDKDDGYLHGAHSWLKGNREKHTISQYVAPMDPRPLRLLEVTFIAGD